MNRATLTQELGDISRHVDATLSTVESGEYALEDLIYALDKIQDLLIHATGTAHKLLRVGE